MSWFSKTICKRVTKNKTFELQTCHESWLSFELGFSWTFKEDHAGIRFNITLFGFTLYTLLYDNRHWDDEKGEWVTYE